MKTKFKSKLLSILLVLVMVLSVAPLGALTVFAAETEITELSFSFKDEEFIPSIGKPIIAFDTYNAIEANDDRIYIMSGTTFMWRDEDGEIINYSEEDCGCYFEAGRTYYVEFDIYKSENCELSENVTLTLTNSGEFTSVIEEKFAPNALAHIRLSITMDGQRNYPDITKIVFEDMYAPIKDGTKQHAVIRYNNCVITKDEWIGSVWGESAHGNQLFVSGNSYDYVVTLTANDGYKFSETPSVMLICEGEEQQPKNYKLSNDNKILTMTYTFFVKDFVYVNSVDLGLSRWYETLIPK